MAKKELTKTSKLLIYLASFEDVIAPFTNVYEMRNRLLFGSKGSFNSTVYRLYQRGWIKLVDKNAEKFIKLTKKGELEALVVKAFSPPSAKWDGKWRIITFDIPENCKGKRHLLRKLLRDNGYIKLQASVYVNPYPINREGIAYLQRSKLISYIRMLKVEEMDNDSDLKKYFHLH